MANPTQLALNSQKILEENGTPGVIAQTVARLVYTRAEKTKNSQSPTDINSQELEQLQKWFKG